MFIGGNVNGFWTKMQTDEITKEINWDAVWYFPAIMALVVLIAFFFMFDDSKDKKTITD